MSHPDQEAAVASLAIEHDVVDVKTAAELIQRCRVEQAEPILELLDTTAINVMQLYRVIADELHVEFVDLFETGSDYQLSPAALGHIDIDWLRRYQAVPLSDSDNNVVIATANPTNPRLADYLDNVISGTYRMVLADPMQVSRLLDVQASELSVLMPSAGDDDSQDEDVLEVPEEEQDDQPAAENLSPVRRWLENLMLYAASNRASDIHLELQADRTLLVRLRIDGMLLRQTFPLRGREPEALGALLNRANMDASNLREPQDGSFSFQVTDEGETRKVDCRVAMIPLVTGPKVVVRLLDPRNLAKDISELGFGQDQLDVLIDAVQQKQGTIVVVGPTGSGKTTTLYAMLRRIATIEKNVQTVEDPVEYRLPLVSQTQVRAGIGDRSVTFARALRTILRLDPDVILVGEVRDTETARVTMEAAITGHLVLTTLHAPSAAEAYTRLTEMGVPGFLVGQAVNLLVSQRLLRRLCDSCVSYSEPTPEERQLLEKYGQADATQVGRPQGCRACNNTGFRGRVVVAEVLVPSQKMQAMVARGEATDDLLEEADRTGFRPIVFDGFRHVAAGDTTPEEALSLLELADT